MRIFSLISGILFFTSSLWSQKYIEPDQLKTFNIVVNYDTYTVKTQMLKDNKKVKIYNDRTYMWCSANKIIETKGGYDGKLLHGYYKSFYFDNVQLREAGTVKYGLKDKEWRTWYPDGKLKEIIQYSHGKKHGKYTLYNDYGNVMAKGRFRNDQLNGHFYTYDNFGHVQDRKKYHNGIEVVAKPKKQKAPRVAKEKRTAKKRNSSRSSTDSTSSAVSKKENKSNTPAPVSDQIQSKKRSFGHKVRDLFKRKEKMPAHIENKSIPATS